MKIEECSISSFCEPCTKGKQTRKPFPQQTAKHSTEILQLVHTDVCGPINPPTPRNKRYALTIIDDYSRYTHVYLLEHKSEAAGKVKEFVKMTETAFGKKPKIIRSDRGLEYLNSDLISFIKKEGIQAQYTAPYTPEQNGVAERKNRSLIEMVRCMLISANLNRKYWGEAILTANYLQNRLPSRVIDKTPFELWFSEKPNVKVYVKQKEHFDI